MFTTNTDTTFTFGMNPTGTTPVFGIPSISAPGSSTGFATPAGSMTGSVSTSAMPNMMNGFSSDPTLDQHMTFLSLQDNRSLAEEVKSAPVFTMPVLKNQPARIFNSSQTITQYGLLAGAVNDNYSVDKPNYDPRIFQNVSAPSSTFICGSQGSGKSHTLSCMLENCLIPSMLGKLPKPLTGLVFHYDHFTSDSGGSPCEAAYISSSKAIKVRVLVSPSNMSTMKRLYAGLNVAIEPLRINQVHLNTSRMLDMMAVSTTDGPVPLYLQTIRKILRSMRIAQQETGQQFKYSEFKEKILAESLTSQQLGPLALRLDLLESFLPPGQIQGESKNTAKKPRRGSYDVHGNDWTPKAGTLTIVDLSCPFVSPESACALFSICLGIFLEQETTTGRIVALDEAHKFMGASDEATSLTNSLVDTIRLQRHIGTRVIIATQEPTISPRLLDLCSVTIVHRFSSPEWFRTLKGHLSALVFVTSKEVMEGEMFEQIVNLSVGQALLFAPSATLELYTAAGGKGEPLKLGNRFVKMKTRNRGTADGGKSIMA